MMQLIKSPMKRANFTRLKYAIFISFLFSFAGLLHLPVTYQNIKMGIWLTPRRPGPDAFFSPRNLLEAVILD